ncbi:MAG: hypothetical protein C4294_04680, partial [Nitrospiraceae bacterium]
MAVIKLFKRSLGNRSGAELKQGHVDSHRERFPGSGEASGIRINKFFTQQGMCSRREADRLIEEGRVAINGQTAVLGDRVRPGDV